MFCPACGAENKDPEQRYCRECGASLPAAAPRQQSLVRRARASDLPARLTEQSLHPAVLGGMKNKLIAGAVGVVVLIVALNVIIHLIIATITAVLLPLTVLVAIGILGYFYLRGFGRR